MPTVESFILAVNLSDKIFWGMTSLAAIRHNRHDDGMTRPYLTILPRLVVHADLFATNQNGATLPTP